LHLYYHLYGLPYVSLRIANAYGERQDPKGAQGVIAVFLGKIIQGQPIQIWGDGRVVRDYVHARDIVAAFLRAMEREQKEARIFNIGSGQGISLNELVDLIKKNLGIDFPVQYSKARRIDVPVNVLNISLARKKLHWEPQISLGAGVRQVFNYMRALNQSDSKDMDVRKNGIY
jgi:UDP-glucose 4-epimerase